MYLFILCGGDFSPLEYIALNMQQILCELWLCVSVTVKQFQLATSEISITLTIFRRLSIVNIQDLRTGSEKAVIKTETSSVGLPSVCSHAYH